MIINQTFQNGDIVVLNDVNKGPLRYEGPMHFLPVGRN